MICLLYSLSIKNDIQAATNLRDLSYELGFKIYPLSQTLYDLKEDFEVYQALRLIDNEEVVQTGDYHFKNQFELEEEFFMFEECFNNFEAFVKEVDVIWFMADKLKAVGDFYESVMWQKMAIDYECGVGS